MFGERLRTTRRPISKLRRKTRRKLLWDEYITFIIMLRKVAKGGTALTRHRGAFRKLQRDQWGQDYVEQNIRRLSSQLAVRTRVLIRISLPKVSMRTLPIAT